MAYINVSETKMKERLPLADVPCVDRLLSGVVVRLDRVLPEHGPDSVCGNGLKNSEILFFLRNLLNYEIVERGDSYPFPAVALRESQFLEYYASSELFVCSLVEDRNGERDPKKWPTNTAEGSTGTKYEFGNRIIGSFYIKPNYPHRSAHICNGGFLVVPAYQRHFGIGTYLGEMFVLLAAELGYKASMFNLVYATNLASVKTWKRLGFRHVNTLPLGGLVKVRGEGKPGAERVEEKYVDTLQFYCDVQDKAKELRARRASIPSKL